MAALQHKAAEIDKRFGGVIRERRHRANLTQLDVGQKIGVSYQQIQKYETGANRVSISALVGLADALGTTPAELVGEITIDIEKE